MKLLLTALLLSLASCEMFKPLDPRDLDLVFEQIRAQQESDKQPPSKKEGSAVDAKIDLN